MSFNIFDITTIEEEVRDIVRGLGVSSKVYTNRPKEAEPSLDFVVVSVSGGTEDMKAYGDCVIDINLFAKDIDSFKNGKRLSVMYRALAEGFPSSSENLIFDTDFRVLGDTPDDSGFHARIIRIKTTIKSS
jgi:hypothetical protein